jgi:dTDP-4-dehydrorhamnose reductase
MRSGTVISRNPDACCTVCRSNYGRTALPISQAHLGDASPSSPPELWGGHECTVNRVGDTWFDQTVRGGHQDRPDDVAMFAALGIRKLRYPVLWERIAPESPEVQDFAWTDERLPEIRRLGMDPIVTLCHHGSGPRYTSLLDDNFATGLARHAEAVASRYPWIEDYTPVNEPLTTARFSALYGFWYPHARDEGAFWLALLNEIDATRISMRAIRRINPAARLIQTDDLGYCHATAPLQAEADFQNDRRWAGWDLLCGTVVPGHPLWDRIAQWGLGDRLRQIADDPCPPDVIGINHYLSSERLLDHRIELHGARGIADRAVGDSAGTPLVDVDAVRAMPDEVIGFAGLVEQAWDRYRLPIAVTECHNGSTRDEQARWFIEAWDKVAVLRTRGVDVRAMTAWSLLGSYDWNRMVTCSAGHYEPGVFDVRGERPRPTLMARVLLDLAHGRRSHGPGLEVPGWWRADRRAMRDGPGGFALTAGPRDSAAPAALAIIAGDPVLTEAIASACEARGLHYFVLDRATPAVLAGARPWGIVDARLNGADQPGSEWACFCAERNIIGATIAVGGASRASDALGPEQLLVETAPLFGPAGQGFCAEVLDALDRGEQVVVDARQVWQETYLPSLVDGVLDLLMDGANGRFLFSPEPGWTQAGIARALAHVAGHDPAQLLDLGDEAASPATPGPGPSNLPSLEMMLERFVHDRRYRRMVDAEQGEMLLEAAE